MDQEPKGGAGTDAARIPTSRDASRDAPYEATTGTHREGAATGAPHERATAHDAPGASHGRVRDEARESAGRVTDEVSRAAREVGPRISEGARTALRETKNLAAEQVDGLARALRAASRELRDSRQEPLARYNDAVAGGIERTAAYLRERDPDALAEDARLLARRRPALLAGSLLAVGLMTASVFAGGRARRASPRTDDAYAGYDGVGDDGLDERGSRAPAAERAAGDPLEPAGRRDHGPGRVNARRDADDPVARRDPRSPDAPHDRRPTAGSTTQEEEA